MTIELESPEVIESIGTNISDPFKVVVFDDAVHTFEEVIYQIVKATKCARQVAEAKTFEIHHTGRSVVFSGEMSKCIIVSGILEEIHLMTQIES